MNQKREGKSDSFSRNFSNACNTCVKMSTFIFIFVRLSVPQKYASFKNKIKKKQIRCHFDIGISSEEEEMAVEMDHNQWGEKGKDINNGSSKKKTYL